MPNIAWPRRPKRGDQYALHCIALEWNGMEESTPTPEGSLDLGDNNINCHSQLGMGSEGGYAIRIGSNRRLERKAN